MINSVKEYVKDMVLDKLDNYISSHTKLENDELSIAYTLWEQENTNGTITFSKQEAKKWIVEHFDDLDEIMESYHCGTGEYLNPFGNPEIFMVQICFEVTRDLISEVYTEGMTTKQLYKALKDN